MIRKILPVSLFLMLLSKYIQCQILIVSPGTEMLIKPGTIFSMDKFTLVPSSDFSFTNISVNKNTTVSQPTNDPYIARVYKFSETTNPFSGTIQINYIEGSELNGLLENTLQFNVQDGTAWKLFTSTENNLTDNYVLASISGIPLNEITLAGNSTVLPLQWRSFAARKHQENVLLEWSTFLEQNTKSFVIQHSLNGIRWTSLGTIAAAGNAGSLTHYNYLHNAAVSGYNYYRITETDLDGKKNYSEIQRIFFGLPGLHIELMGNPVTNGMLQVRLEPARQNDKAPVLKLYTSDGKLLWEQQALTGVNSINVSGYAKGAYLLQVNETTIKFLIR